MVVEPAAVVLAGEDRAAGTVLPRVETVCQTRFGLAAGVALPQVETVRTAGFSLSRVETVERALA